MRGPTIYYVGGEKSAWSTEDFALLAQALPAFGAGFYHPEGFHTGNPAARPQAYWVARDDKKPFVKAELTALYWYFRGVVEALGIMRANQ